MFFKYSAVNIADFSDSIAHGPEMIVKYSLDTNLNLFCFIRSFNEIIK